MDTFSFDALLIFLAVVIGLMTGGLAALIYYSRMSVHKKRLLLCLDSAPYFYAMYIGAIANPIAAVAFAFPIGTVMVAWIGRLIQSKRKED